MRNYHNLTLCHGYQLLLGTESPDNEPPKKIPCDRPLTNDEVVQFANRATMTRVLPDNTILFTTRRMQLHRLHEFFDERPLTERMVHATSPEFVLLSNYARIAQCYANNLRRSAEWPTTREEVELDNLVETSAEAFNERFESVFREEDQERAVATVLHREFYRYYTGLYGRERREEREENYRQFIEEGRLFDEPDLEGEPIDPQLVHARPGDARVFRYMGAVSNGDYRVKVRDASSDLPDFSNYGVTREMNDDQITETLRQAYENARQEQTRASIATKASNVLKTCTNKVGKAAFICGAPIFLPYFLVKLIGAYITLSDRKNETRQVQKDVEQYMRARNIRQELTPALEQRVREHLEVNEVDDQAAPAVPNPGNVPPDLFDDMPDNDPLFDQADPLVGQADNQLEDSFVYTVVDLEDVRQALLGPLAEETRATALSLNGHAIDTSPARPTALGDAPPNYRRANNQSDNAPPTYEEALALPTVIKPQ